MSFALDDEEEQDLAAPSKKKQKLSQSSNGGGKASFKNPDVDTSFLPDRKREEDDRRVREELRQEWLKKQEEMKKEEIEITYSYWDGSGHRKSVKVRGLRTEEVLYLAAYSHPCNSAKRETRSHNSSISAGSKSLSFEVFRSTT